MIVSHLSHFRDESSNAGADAGWRRGRGSLAGVSSATETLVDDAMGGAVAAVSKRSISASIVLGVGTAVLTHLSIRLLDKLFLGEKR